MTGRTTQSLQHSNNGHLVSADTVESEDACDECGGDLIQAEEHQESYCQDCGLVLEAKNIDRGPEWRAYNTQERNRKSRVGAPTTHLLHDKGLTTNISWKNTDGYGQTLSANQRKRMQRLRKWNKRVRYDTSGNSESFGIAEIRRMGSALGSPKQPKETAAMIFRQARAKEILIGRSVESVSSASLYIALKEHNVPRSLDEIAMVSRAERKAIMRSQRAVARGLGLETTITSPQDYLPRYASKLDVPRELEREAEQLVRDAEGKQILGSGSRPDVLAACALYAAGITINHMLTQRKISNELSVTTVSIRNHYRDFIVASDRYPVTETDIEENGTPRELAALIQKRANEAGTGNETVVEA